MVSQENSPSHSSLAALGVLGFRLAISTPLHIVPSRVWQREEQPPAIWSWCPFGEARAAGKRAGNPCSQPRSGSCGRPGLLKKCVSAIGVHCWGFSVSCERIYIPLYTPGSCSPQPEQRCSVCGAFCVSRQAGSPAARIRTQE